MRVFDVEALEIGRYRRVVSRREHGVKERNPLGRHGYGAYRFRIGGYHRSGRKAPVAADLPDAPTFLPGRPQGKLSLILWATSFPRVAQPILHPTLA
jgi:hypothetical protein